MKTVHQAFVAKERHEAALGDREDLFRLLVEGVKDYAIFMLDVEGRVMTWNTGAERIKGYKSDEIIGRHFSCFYPPERIEQKWPQQELAYARAEGRFEDEGWRVRKDGSLFWANVVITALYDASGQLRGYGKVTRDMTERKKMEALEDGVRHMNEFLAMLAHELRNPLAPMRNAIEIMSMKQLDDPSLEWSRAIIDRQAEHLARLVDDLLDTSRITSGKIALQKAPIAIADIVARAVEANRPLLDARGHVIDVSLPSEPMFVTGDLLRLSQVVLNLLNNAAKYTPEGGRIWLTAERLASEAVIRVCDNGVGIPADMLEQIFELFMQGDRALDRTEGGLGIGLTLARRLVEMHGGTLVALSDGFGQGSEFVVRLPLLANDHATASVHTNESDQPAAKALCRVLIVDDSRDSADSMAMLLAMWGHEVRMTYDGPDALAAAAEFRPDVVLLDIGLPGLDGYEVARRLPAATGSARAVIVAMTGYGQDEDRSRAFAAGMHHHLIKPVDSAALQAILASAGTGSSA
jgi:PAS domain S-box-containing protein